MGDRHFGHSISMFFLRLTPIDMPDIEQLHTEYASRRRRTALAATLSGALFLLSAISIGMFVTSLNGADTTTGTLIPSRRTTTFLSALEMPVDTLYTQGDQILEIRLDRQMLFRRWRNGRIDSFRISTGNPALNKGIETRPGLYLIQNKIEWLYSLQFDSTKVFNWLGFNFGVGFHSLEGTRYYRNLGVRPSSHGCVRMSAEDAHLLFTQVPLGTPVFVHKQNSARIPAFLPPGVAIDTNSFSTREVVTLYEQRLRDLYRGRRLLRSYANVPLMKRHIGHAGVPIGDTAFVPSRQRAPSPSYAFVTMPPIRPPRLPRLPRWTGTKPSEEKESIERNILP
jgi:hypothetical protein